MATPAISIILPIYNVERFLEQCLDSVVGQTLEDIEIICVDDGSTDGSAAIIDGFAARDSRVLAVHKENGGYGKAVNTGLDMARGEYIGIVEPDDYVDTAMFEKLLAQARRFGNPDIVKGAYWRVCNADSPEESVVPCFYHGIVEHTDVPFSLDEDAEFLYHHPSIWTAIYRRGFLEAHGVRMMEIPGAGWADNPWLIETLVQAGTIVYLDECLYYYREFNAGSSSNIKDPSLVSNRWCDMDDILKRLGTTAPRIWEGHFNRGCAYIGMLKSDVDQNTPGIQECIDAIVARMDLKAVLRSQRIAPHYKGAYLAQVKTLSWLAHPCLALYRIARSLKRRLGGRR